jgi:hypothetical protein
MTSQSNLSFNYSPEKEQLVKKIKDIEREIESLEMSLAYEPQTANGYRTYEASSKALNDKRKALQKEYDDLFSAEELAQRKAQEAHELDIKKQQAVIEMQQKAVIERDRLATYVIRDAELRFREQEESARMRSWIDTSLQQYEEHVKNLISNNSQNKDFLESELTKLESDWDETTRFGQPPNAAYLYKTYAIKKNQLTDAIRKL